MSRRIGRLAIIVFASFALHGAKAGSSITADILDVIEVPVRAADGAKINELSGLAWDADEKLLYAVSDNGYLHHFRLDVANDKFASVEPAYSVAIKDTAVGALSWDLTNAEGLHVRNGDNGKQSDSELVIAFEDGPAIGRFTPQGEFLKEIALLPPLADPDSYNSANKRLESVTEMPDIGMVTAPEAHLADEPEGIHSIFAMDGRKWSFPALQTSQSSVKALDPLPDGRILVLERTRDPETDAPQAHLRIVDIANCASGSLCSSIEVAISDAAVLADDFEGMTRITDDLYLIITDARHGGRLVLFRLRN